MSSRIPTARLTCLLALVVATCLPATPAWASKSQETILEDDTMLVTKPPDTVRSTLDTMRALGADRIRVLVFWNQLAFNPDSRISPTPDDSRADNPESYSPAGWANYDLIVREAEARGIKVDLDLAPPAPLWATLVTDDPELQYHYKPIANWFRHFAAAVGRRYSGSFPDPLRPGRNLPRVSFWSLWNEPNEWHFLAPQYATPTSPVERAASLYRDLVDAGYAGLSQSGHGGDIILIGETAPKGRNDPGSHHSLKPLRFIRAFYCVDRKFRPLQGTAAQNLVCPTTSAGRASFAADHPGLFQATGWGHHPYALATRPSTMSRDPDDLALADLPRLTKTLRSAFGAYGRGGGLPIYLTEFGFQTRPPDPFGLPPNRQSDFINQSEFAVYGNSRVRSYSQFLLVDDGPDARFPASSFFYWNNFQTGLVWGAGSGLDGRQKPAFGAFRIPIFLPRTQSPRAATFRVWGGVRPAPNGTPQIASIQFRGRSGPFKQIKLASTTNFRGYVDTKVRITRTGQVRIAWTDPVAKTTLFSRNVGVKIGR